MRVGSLVQLLSQDSSKNQRLLIICGRLLDNNFVRFIFKVGLLVISLIFGLFLFFHIRGKTISIGNLSFVDLYPSYKKLENIEGEEIVRGIYMYNTGALHLRTLPRNVAIYLDNKFIGNSSYFIVGKVVDGLLPGEHILNLTKDGFLPYKRSFTVWPKHVINVDAILLKKPDPETYSFDTYVINPDLKYKIITTYLPDYLVLVRANNRYMQLIKLSKLRAKEPLFNYLPLVLGDQYEYRVVELSKGRKLFVIIDKSNPEVALAFLIVDKQNKPIWVNAQKVLKLVGGDGNYKLNYIGDDNHNQDVSWTVKDLEVAKDRLIIILDDRVVEYGLRKAANAYRIAKQVATVSTTEAISATPRVFYKTAQKPSIELVQLTVDDSNRSILYFNSRFFDFVDRKYFYVLHVKDQSVNGTVLFDVELFDTEGRHEMLLKNLHLRLEPGEQVVTFKVGDSGIFGNIGNFIVITNKRILVFGDIIPTDTDFVITESALPFGIDDNVIVYPSNIKGKELLSISYVAGVNDDPTILLHDNYVIFPWRGNAYVLVFNKVSSDLLVRLGLYRVCDTLPPLASETILGVHNGYLFSLVKETNESTTTIRACEILGENDYDYYKIPAALSRNQVWLDKEYIFWIMQQESGGVEFTRVKAMVK